MSTIWQHITAWQLFVLFCAVERGEARAWERRKVETARTLINRCQAGSQSCLQYCRYSCHVFIAFVIYWLSARYCVTFCTTRPFDGVVHATFSCQALTIMYICRRPVGLVDLTTAQQNQVYISAEWLVILCFCLLFCLSFGLYSFCLSVCRKEYAASWVYIFLNIWKKRLRQRMVH